jgi:hypothetical protein
MYRMLIYQANSGTPLIPGVMLTAGVVISIFVSSGNNEHLGWLPVACRPVVKMQSIWVLLTG